MDSDGVLLAPYHCQMFMNIFHLKILLKSTKTLQIVGEL